MRVNSQNVFRMIGLCACIILITLSVGAYAQGTEVEELKKLAKQGDVSSQYFLGTLYKEGSMIEKSPALAYVWFSLAAKQGFEDAEHQKNKIYADIPKEVKPSAKVMVEQYYRLYVIPFIPAFEINLNGEKITKSKEVSPDIPIYVIFKHTSPKVTKVRMQYTGKSSKYKIFELDRPHSLANHEHHMKSGRKSRSMFLAIDDDNNVYNQIIITFNPEGEQEVGEQEDENEDSQ